MAKKKKGKHHAHPVAPPVHSAPASATAGPVGGPQTTTPPARPMGAGPPHETGQAPAPVHSEPRRPRQTPAQRRAEQKSKNRRRNLIMGAVVLILFVGGLVFQRMNANKADASFNKLAASAGCGTVRSTSGSGAGEHLADGEATTYDTSPPTHGKHALSPLPAGVYAKPLSDDPTDDQNIFRAVHSLEHGAVIIWYDKLTQHQVDDLDKRYQDEVKVLVVPYPQLKGSTHVALTAWGRLADCQRPSTRYIDGFIKRYRNSRNAPEPNNTI